MQPEPLSLGDHPCCIAIWRQFDSILLLLLAFLERPFFFCTALFARAVPSAVPNGSPAAASLLCNRRLRHRLEAFQDARGRPPLARTSYQQRTLMQASMLVQKCAAKRTTLVPVLVTVLVLALITLKRNVAGVDRNAARHSVRSVHGCALFALCLLLVVMPGALRLCSCFAVAGHVLCICDGGLDGGGEVSKRDKSLITLVSGLEGLSWRLP